MTARLSLLTEKRALWGLFALTLLLTATFGVVMSVWNFTIIDEMWDPAAVQSHVEAMTPAQRRAHAWLTATVDVIYPVTYAALFAGLALRYLGRAGPLVAALSAAIVPADLVEGLAQVMILNGDMTWLATKAAATPLKLALYVPALVLACIAAVLGVVARFRT